MALFQDGNITQIRDLTRYESSIIEVANTESIDLFSKMTLSDLELSLQLKRFLLRLPLQQLQSFDLNNIVVTGALKQWHTLNTIAITYRDAYNQQINDRYRGKWQEYLQLAREASELLFEVGVGMVFAPISRPETPTLSEVLGNQPQQTWYAAISWITSQGAESAPGPIASINARAGTALMVTPPAAPMASYRFNVYVGLTSETLQLQNSAPIASGNAWTMPSTGLRDGAAPGSGQMADVMIRKVNHIQRG
jgi:hypothetical protein